MLVHYGGNPPTCKCCGESQIEFLSIDHVNGGGNQHRKELGHGVHFDKWLIDNGYPEGFQVLCHNCNLAKGYYGYCPHSLVVSKRDDGEPTSRHATDEELDQFGVDDE